MGDGGKVVVAHVPQLVLSLSKEPSRLEVEYRTVGESR